MLAVYVSERDRAHVLMFHLSTICLCVFLIWAHVSLLLHNSQTGFWSHFLKMRCILPRTHTSVRLCALAERNFGC